MSETSGQGRKEPERATADSKDTDRKEPERRRRTATGPGGLHRARSALASLVWMLAVLAALVLAVGALLVALGFNADHPLVEFVIETALRIDLGELKAFEGTGDDVRTKWVLVNWGIAAVAYLVVGKLLDRVIRP